jgi:flagellar motor protein MotB
MSGSKKDSHWIPLADLMTVLMVIFLFMSISYMALVQKKQKQTDLILTEYQSTRDSIKADLNSIFQNDFKRWNMILDDNLSIKFINPQALFEVGSKEITPYYQGILIDFLPKYMAVVTDKNYADKIAEIRIEGHTDTFPMSKDGDPYMENMELSQGRARNVLAFLRSQDCFKKLTIADRERMQFLFTANGLSFSRTVDADGNLTQESKKPAVMGRSRRVEFRIITTSEKTIEEATKQVKGKK